jgi:hypothetical protein
LYAKEGENSHTAKRGKREREMTKKVQPISSGGDIINAGRMKVYAKEKRWATVVLVKYIF